MELTLDQKREAAYQFSIYNPRCYLMLDMGFGKTYIALRTLAYRFMRMESRSAFIVAPLNVAELVWPAEIKQFPEFHWLSYSLILGTPKQRIRALRAKALIYITNYENLTWLSKILDNNLIDFPHDTIIFDELSKMKSPSTKRFTAFRPHLERFKYRMGLSGTPCPNSIGELWSQIYCLDSGASLGDNYSKGFRPRFFEKDPYIQGKYSIRPHSEVIIQDLISPLVFRSSYDLDVSVEVVDVTFSLPRKVQEMYDKFEKEMFLQLDEEREVVARTRAIVMNKLLQFVGGWLYYIKGHTDKGKPIVDYHFIHEAKVAKLYELTGKKLKDHNAILCYNYTNQLPVLQHLGEVFPKSRKQKREYQDRWNAGKIKNLVAHPASIGHGLNLQTGGDTVIWFGVPWSLEQYLQTNKRLCRPGQKKPVTIYRLLCLDTVDMYVSALIEMKDHTQEALKNALDVYRHQKQEHQNKK